MELNPDEVNKTVIIEGVIEPLGRMDSDLIVALGLCGLYIWVFLVLPFVFV